MPRSSMISAIWLRGMPGCDVSAEMQAGMHSTASRAQHAASWLPRMLATRCRALLHAFLQDGQTLEHVQGLALIQGLWA